MSQRLASKSSFREAVAALGLPVSDDEFEALWEMVQGVHDQADSLRRYLNERDADR